MVEPGRDKSNLPYFTDDKGKFVPMWLAQDIMNDYYFATHEKSEELYVYEDGIYTDRGETVVKKACQNKLESFVKNHYVNETLDAVKRENFTPKEKFNNPTNYLAVENGLLSIKERELKDFSPNHIHLTKIPVEYDPSKDCPKIKSFISDIVNRGDIKLIQEMIGYCLLKKYSIAKAFMLLGSGANGKSTFLNLLETFLGRENVANPSLQELLENRFAKIELFGKLANIHADLSPDKLENTGTFKKLTGEDELRGEKKFQDAIKFRNYAKLIFAANELPKTGDRTDAFFRRWVIIEFPNKFPQNDLDTDPNILEKITSDDELSGLLNWALDGLDRLLDKGRFSQTAPRERIEEEWIRRTDSLRAFVDQVCIVDPNAYISKEDFMDVYKGFCNKHNIYAVKKGQVTKNLPSMKPSVDLYRPEINGERIRCWRNITLKHEAFSEDYVQRVQPICSEAYESFEEEVYKKLGKDLGGLEKNENESLKFKILTELKYEPQAAGEIAEEFDINTDEAKDILEALYDEDEVKKKARFGREEAVYTPIDYEE